MDENINISEAMDMAIKMMIKTTTPQIIQKRFLRIGFVEPHLGQVFADGSR